jgi:hypothetical protein
MEARTAYLYSLLLWGAICCIPSPSAWGNTDKTIVDLERGQPEAASRYARPRGAILYHFDKTEMDLATPLSELPNGEDRKSPAASTPWPSKVKPPPK